MKADAREPLIEAVQEHDWSDKILSYRTKGIDTKWWYEDVIEIVSRVGEHIGDLIVPKVASPSDVHTVENLLESVEVNSGLEARGIGLEP